MPTPAPLLTHSEALHALHAAIDAQDLPEISRASAKVNWQKAFQHDRHPVPDQEDFGEFSVLGRLADNSESGTPGERTAYLRFARQALTIMARAGFRLLDDSYALELITQYVRLARVVGQVAAQVGVRTEEGGTMLHLGLMSGVPYLDCVSPLLTPAVEINARDDDGRTALHLLWVDSRSSEFASRDHAEAWLETLTWFLENSADEAAVDGAGQTPRQLMELALSSDGPNGSGLARHAALILTGRQRVLTKLHQATLDREVAPAPARSPPRM